MNRYIVILYIRVIASQCKLLNLGNLIVRINCLSLIVSLIFVQLAIQVVWPIKSSIGLPDIVRVARERAGETSFTPKRHSCDKRCATQREMLDKVCMSLPN